MCQARLAAMLAAVAFAAGPAAAQLEDPLPDIPLGDTTVSLETVAEELTSPVWLLEPDDGTGRLLIVEQDGFVRVLDDGAMLPTPFLDVSGRLVPPREDFDERGLLGLALHPGFTNPGSDGYRKLYTYTSEPLDGPADFSVPIDPGEAFDHQSVIAEWEVSGDDMNLVDPASRREILRIDQPQFNHVAGALLFGPDDNQLYVALGDGGAGDDQGVGHVPGGNAQDTGNILGNILRIDPMGTNGGNGQYGIPEGNPFPNTEHPDGLEEIWAYGFRNPFRMSFDVPTGNLYVGDAGQNDIEEVDLLRPEDVGGNFGWRLKEGSFAFDPNGSGAGFVTEPDGSLPPGLIDPKFEYDHDEGLVVIGGFVYRGSLLSDELGGKYIFGEFSGRQTGAGRLFAGDLDTGEIEELQIAGMDNLGSLLLSFGQDNDGELYVLTSPTPEPTGNDSTVYKIVPEPSTLGLVALGGLAALRRRKT